MEDTKKCPLCAKEIPADATVCPQCGGTLEGTAESTAMVTKPILNEENNTVNDRSVQEQLKLIGWSEKTNDPSINKKPTKDYRKAQFVTRMISWSIVLIATLVGYYVQQIPLLLSVFVGLVIAVIVYIIGDKKTSFYTQPAWEGTVTDKRIITKKGKDSNGNGITYHLYKVYFKTTDKRSRSTISEEMYNYLKKGDRVRFHPRIQYFEKYDKSHDKNIYCCVCKTPNPIENDKCLKCGSILIKP